MNREEDFENGKMTENQRDVSNAIKSAVKGNRTEKQFIINTRGGTGKTFLLNLILSYVRLLDENSIGLAVAFTGIAATLLKGGRTFNSRFKFPIQADALASCNISKGTGLARLIKNAKVIIWDEAPMNNKVLLEALDKLLKDLMENDQPFGGKVIVLAGDFRQLPTVIQKESRAQIVHASFKRSHLWQNFKEYELK